MNHINNRKNSGVGLARSLRSGRGHSPRGSVLPAAAVAGHATAVARPKRGVATHAGRHQRQADQRRPAQAEALVAGVAGARVRVVALRVRHAVVQQAVGAPHEADPPDAGLDGVGRLLAPAPPIVLVVEHLLTVNATETLPVLHVTLAFGRRRSRLQRHHRPAAAARLQAARFAVVASLHTAAQRVRVRVVVFGRPALGEAHAGVRVVRLREFVTSGVGVTVVLVAREPGPLTGADANDLLLLQREVGVTRKDVDRLRDQIAETAWV